MQGIQLYSVSIRTSVFPHFPTYHILYFFPNSLVVLIYVKMTPRLSGQVHGWVQEQPPSALTLGYSPASASLQLGDDGICRTGTVWPHDFTSQFVEESLQLC